MKSRLIFKNKSTGAQWIFLNDSKYKWGKIKAKKEIIKETCLKQQM